VAVSGGGSTPTGTVTVTEGTTTLGTATLSAGAASIALPATLAAGQHTLGVRYSGDARHAGQLIGLIATVNWATSTTSATAPARVKRKQDFDVDVSVAAPGGKPTGTVQIFDGSRSLGTGTLVNGAVKITVTKDLKKGKHTLTVKYSGSPNVAASQTTVQVKVKKKKG
jgi:hypothetical protein